MSSISSMARFKNPNKSGTVPSLSRSSNLRRSGSMGSLRRSTTPTGLAPNFNATKTSKSTASYPNLEAEYIKNLQQQIYFLELEANFLRDQTKKATELHPKMTEEATRMLVKLKELQMDVDNMTLEIKRKESNLDMVSNEKERLDSRLKMLDETHSREKKLLVEEVVMLKKQNDIIQREISEKDREILQAKAEVDSRTTSLSNAEHQIHIIKAQLDQKNEQLKSTQLALEEKRTDLVKTQSQLHEMEDRFYSSTAALQDKAVQDHKDQIRVLQQKFREAELTAEQDRYMKNKMSDDCANLVKENALFGAQILELNKQLERERDLRESRDTKHATSITELVSFRDKEKHHQFELNQLKDQLRYERERVEHLMQQLSKQEHLNTTSTLGHNTTKSRLAELEGRHGGLEQENTALRRDKMLLVDHVSDLQRQLSEKEQEVISLQTHVRSMELELQGYERKSMLESTIQSQKWGEFEKMAESMKKLSHSMTARSMSPDYA
ncbi:myosin-2-like [Anneissia japonica]|uniref:myosin-2-like n=1 Tax=Anneissia japonica TaxID=1529436 RepID=UPI0014259C0E|nr:myosin-2-like [Anneissia japonica]